MVDGDLFTLVGDIPELDKWTNCCHSCNLFCRKCFVSIFEEFFFFKKKYPNYLNSKLQNKHF